MKQFVVLATWTEAGRRSPADAHADLEDTAVTGVTVTERYFTRGGTCDAVVVIEAGDDDAGHLFALQLAALGRMTATALSVTSAENFKRIAGQITHP